MHHQILPTQLEDRPVGETSGKIFLQQDSVLRALPKNTTDLRINQNMYEENASNEMNQTFEFYNTQPNDDGDLNETNQFYNFQPNDIDQRKDATQFVSKVFTQSGYPFNVHDYDEVNETAHFVNNVFTKVQHTDKKNNTAQLVKLQQKRIRDDLAENSVFKIKAKLLQAVRSDRKVSLGRKDIFKSKNILTEKSEISCHNKDKNPVSGDQFQTLKLSCLNDPSKDAFESNQTPKIYGDLVQPNHRLPEIYEVK